MGHRHRGEQRIAVPRVGRAERVEARVVRRDEARDRLRRDDVDLAVECADHGEPAREGLLTSPGPPVPEGDVRSLQHVDEPIETLERAPDAFCIRIEILNGRALRGFIDFCDLGGSHTSGNGAAREALRGGPRGLEALMTISIDMEPR